MLGFPTIDSVAGLATARHGAGDLPDAVDLFDRAAQNAPDRLALIDDQGHEYTFNAMRRLSNQVARQLIDDGFQPQTRFSVLSPNSK